VASADNASIAAGQTQGSFTITTHTVQFPQTAVIHPATSLTPSLTLTVDSAPPQLQGIYVFPATIPAGTQAEIDFVLSSPALGAGAVIALSSSDTTVLKLPPTVTVPFSIPSTYVFVTPPYSGTDHTVVVTASYLGVTLQKTIQVQGPRPSNLLSMDQCIVSGQPIHARVELTIPAPPGGIDIAVVSSDTTQPKMPLIHIRHDQTAKEFDVPTTAVGGTEGLTLTAVGNGVGTTLSETLVPPQSFWMNLVEPADVHQKYPTNDAFGMNNYGEVAGDVNDGSSFNPSLAYSWFPGNLRILPDLAGMSPPSVALAINDLRQVAGTEGGHAFRYDGTQMLDLTPNGGTGRAISAHGEVAGDMNVAGFPHAFYYDGTLHDLGTLGGTSSQANGINEADAVVGWAFVASGQAHPFLWTTGGGMQDLGVPPGMTQAYALAINRGGVVVGYALDGSSQSHAYKWVSGVPQQLDAFHSGAVAINDAGQIVGVSNGHPVLWDGATRTQLDQLTGNCGGWDNTVVPSAINNRGQIAGTFQTEVGPAATVLSFAQGPTTAVPRVVVVPASFDLAVLGANPVHGALQMICSFAHPGPATLDLVDIAGRRVATRQLNGNASEQQIAIPEAGALSPGVYFARLRQGAGARVARVVLVR
jgi:probable HAF family extracellular repeat protein